MKQSQVWYPRSQAEVYAAAMQAVPSLREASVIYADPAKGVINLSAGMSFWSWGQNITIQVTETAPGQTWLQVLSKSKWPLEITGPNRQNVDTVVGVVSQVLGAGPQMVAAQPQAQGQAPQQPQQQAQPAQPVQPAQPAQPAPVSVPEAAPAPQAAPPSRPDSCDSCDAPLQADAKFCTKCGTPV